MRIGYMLVAAFFLSLSGDVTAGELAYTCEVFKVYSLSENGTLQISGFEKQMKGSSFSVSRVSGEIIGEVVPTLLANSTKVINRGSSENSFKAIADFDDQFQILEIQEFRSVSLKPFVVTSLGGAGIVTGICK